MPKLITLRCAWNDILQAAITHANELADYESDIAIVVPRNVLDNAAIEKCQIDRLPMIDRIAIIAIDAMLDLHEVIPILTSGTYRHTIVCGSSFGFSTSSDSALCLFASLIAQTVPRCIFMESAEVSPKQSCLIKHLERICCCTPFALSYSTLSISCGV
jgi:hypothetical protein